MSNRKFVMIMFALVAGGILVGCPLLPGVSSAPGWRFTFGHEFSLGKRIEQLPDGSFFVAGEFKQGDHLQALLARVVDADDAVALSNESAPFTQGYLEGSAVSILLESGDRIEAGTDLPQIRTDLIPLRLRVRRTDSADNTIWDMTYGVERWAPQDIVLLNYNVLGVVVDVLDAAESRFIAIDLDSGLDLSNVELTKVKTAAAELSDGTLAVVGRGTPSGGESTAFHLSLLNSNYQESMVSAFNLSNDKDVATQIAEAPNGDLVICGTAGDDAALIRVDRQGNLVWSRIAFLGPNEPTEDDEVDDLAITPDGFIAVVGQETNVDNVIGTFPVITFSSYIALLDGNGNLIWKTNLGETEIHGITYTQQGTFMTCGIFLDDLNLIEVDINGNIVN